MRVGAIISLHWYFALGALGVFFPFYSLYLRENAGLSGTEVGLVMAAMPAAAIIAQPLWGRIADRTGARTTILTLVSVGAAVGYTTLGFVSGFDALLVGSAMTSMFASAVIPITVSVSFALLGNNAAARFGRVRVWGTVGFLFTVVVFPLLLDLLTSPEARATAPPGVSQPRLGLMLPATAACLVVAALISAKMPRGGSESLRAARGDWRQIMTHGPFVRLLLFMFGAYACIQGPMALFPIYVRSLGGSVEMVSQMWVVMLILEIPLVWLAGTGFERLGGRGLLAVGLASGAIRWLVCGYGTNLQLIYAVQILHGVTVVGLIVGGPLYVDAVVPPELRSTAQGMLSMMGVSVGGIMSNLWSGMAVDAFGPAAPAAIGGTGALLLTLGLRWIVPRARRAGTEPAGID